MSLSLLPFVSARLGGRLSAFVQLRSSLHGDVLGLSIFFLQGESLGVPKSCWKSARSYVLLKLLPQRLFLELQRSIWFNCRERQDHSVSGNDGCTGMCGSGPTWGTSLTFISKYPNAQNSSGKVGAPSVQARLAVPSIASHCLLESKPLLPDWEKLSVDLASADPGGAA